MLGCVERAAAGVAIISDLGSGVQEDNPPDVVAGRFSPDVSCDACAR